MRTAALVAIALSMVGCGSVWFEEVPVRARVGASATVEVRATASAGGSVEIVEQAPGQGFVVDGDAATFLASFQSEGSFSASSRPCVLASNGGAGVTCATASGSSADGGAVGIDANASTSASGSGLAADDSTSTSRAGVDGVAIGAASGSTSSRDGVAIGGASASGADGAAIGVANDSTGGDGMGSAIGASSGSAGGGDGGALAVSDASATGAIAIEARASVPRDGVWGLDGRATALTALTGPGVQVDGVSVQLSDLEALADLDLPSAPTAELATDAAVEATAELEHATLPRAGGETHVVVRVRARSDVTPPRGRIRVHLVIDRSSSMQRSWGSVLAAARMLVQRLQPDDELQIVAYGSDAVQAYAVGRVGDGSAAVRALDAISVGGGTNIEAGLELAYGAASRAAAGPRSLVILLSDGVPNHGAFEPAELGTLVAGARQRGYTTSVIGLGTEFDARLLRTIAREGRGGYYVSARLDELAAGMVAELNAHARSAASDLSVRVSLPSGVELLDAGQGGAEPVSGGAVLRVPHLDAGEERTIVLRVRVSAGVRAREVAGVTLAYRSGIDGRAVSATKELDVSFGARATLTRDGSVGAGLIDAALASALDTAGDAILDGDASAAVRALDQHADFIEGRVELRQSPVLQARVRVVRRLASAVGALLPGSTHPQRRQVSHAFGALAMRFAR